MEGEARVVMALSAAQLSTAVRALVVVLGDGVQGVEGELLLTRANQRPSEAHTCGTGLRFARDGLPAPRGRGRSRRLCRLAQPGAHVRSGAFGRRAVCEARAAHAPHGHACVAAGTTRRSAPAATSNCARAAHAASNAPRALLLGCRQLRVQSDHMQRQSVQALEAFAQTLDLGDAREEHQHIAIAVSNCSPH